jgi:hypothetical protein
MNRNTSRAAAKIRKGEVDVGSLRGMNVGSGFASPPLPPAMIPNLPRTSLPRFDNEPLGCGKPERHLLNSAARIWASRSY